MKDWHVVGQKVVCIDAKPAIAANRWPRDKWPIEGHQYTIRTVEIHPAGCVSFLLIEIKNKKRVWVNGHAEQSFGHFRFRPLRPTSIESFERLLTSQDIDERILEDV